MNKINKKHVTLINEYLDLLDENIEVAKKRRDEAWLWTLDLLFWTKRAQNLERVKWKIEKELNKMNNKLEELGFKFVTK